MTSPRAILTALVGALLFLSPLVIWTAHLAPAWWWPFLAWAALVALIAISQPGARRDP